MWEEKERKDSVLIPKLQVSKMEKKTVSSSVKKHVHSKKCHIIYTLELRVRSD